jgi:RNA polymerase sigma-70 factor (sigma-E family)
MRRVNRDRSFEEFVSARYLSLRRIAYALCGDWVYAEDLLQSALEKAYVAWPKIQRRGAEEAYVRTTLIRTSIDESRRPWRRERSTDAVPDTRTVPAVDAERPVLVDALMRLPEMQRKVVVLRYWLDQSVSETADQLGIGEGTVKSHAARGIGALRDALAESGVNTP